MDNKKLEKDKEILNQYHYEEKLIKDNEELKYKWYLTLQNILFCYLGVNKQYYSSPDEFRKFPASFFQNSHNCTQEEAKKIINDKVDFLEKLSIAILKLENDINLNKYEKSYLFKKIYFNISNYFNYYKDLELISITFKPGSRIYYEVDKSEEYDMKWEIKDENHYYRRVMGKFLKENITFNINIKYIEKIEVMDNKEIKDLTISQFNKKYKDLNGFIYKELAHLTTCSENNLVTEAVNLISKFINIRALPPIKFIEKLPAGCRGAIGVYYFDTVYITTKPTYTSKLKILIHELGHYIHKEYFDEKQFRFSTKNKGKYANKNYKENFAECFTELVYYREDTERTRKMIKILNEII